MSLIFGFQIAPLTSASGFALPCEISTYGDAWNGYLAYGLTEYDPANTSVLLHSYLIIMNTDGDVVALRETNGSSYFGAVNQIAQDTIMFQGEPGNRVNFWNYVTNETATFPNVSGHHDAEYNPVNNTFLTLENYVREVNGTKFFFDKIVEFDAEGQTLWTWDTYDFIDIAQACPYNDTWPVSGERVIDLTHANSVQWDYNNSVIYLNVRNLNTFYKINQTSGQIIWSCGEYGDFTLLNENGEVVKSLWYHSHAVQEVEPGVFIMFDNDWHNQTNNSNAHSRILEVTLDDQTMTAWASWEWAAPKEYWSTYWGDADRLPNGDRIGIFGTQTKTYSNEIGAVLVEVNPNGEIVRTYTFPRGWGIYRVEELDVPYATDTAQPQTFWPFIIAAASSICIAMILATVHIVRSRTKKQQRPPFKSN